MIWDGKLKGTKCESCLNGRFLILDPTPSIECSTCIDRPTRKKDESHYIKDIPEMKDALDEVARMYTPYEY